MHWLRMAVLVFASLSLVGCDYVEEIDADHPIGQRFIGKSYCSKVPLFVWWFKEAKFEGREYTLHYPIREEIDLEEHRKLGERISAFADDYKILPKGVRLSIKKVNYIGNSFFDSPGYVPLAMVDDEFYMGQYLGVSFIFMPIPGSDYLADKAEVDQRYLVEC